MYVWRLWWWDISETKNLETVEEKWMVVRPWEWKDAERKEKNDGSKSPTITITKHGNIEQVLEIFKTNVEHKWNGGNVDWWN